MECAKSEFDYFLPIPTQTSIVRTFLREYTPLSALQHGAPIEFAVAGTENLYMDLNQSYIYIKCKITKADKTAIAAADKVGPINLTLHSLFSDMDLELCGKQVSDNSGHYCYRALLEELLSYGQDVKETQLQAALWFKDTAGQMTVTDSTGANAGLVSRANFFALSAEVDLIGRPHLDLFHQDKLILGNCPLKLRLIPNADSFILKSKAPGANEDQENYRMQITDARFFVRTVEVSHALALAHEQMLQKMNARYPLRRVTTKHISIPANTTSVMHDNVFLGTVPRRVLITMVSDAAMSGGYQLNPYNFAHNGVKYLALYVNGEMVPHRPYEPEFTAKRYLRDYMSLFEGTGTLFTDKSLPITRDEFANGYAIWLFDLTPDKASSPCISPPRTGSVRLELKFAAGNTATINVLVYAEFDAMIEIDKFRNVIAPNY